MRAVNLNTQIRNFFLSILAILMMFGFNSCTKKATAVTTPIVPEERGQLQVKRDVNSNYVIQINISDLEPVKKLIPAKEAYVVWMVTDMKATKNLGQIEGANTWFSKKDKASFEAVTEFKPSKIFITAENDVTIKKPGTQIVWSTKNF